MGRAAGAPSSRRVQPGMEVRAISVAGQQHGLVTLDAARRDRAAGAALEQRRRRAGRRAPQRSGRLRGRRRHSPGRLVHDRQAGPPGADGARRSGAHGRRLPAPRLPQSPADRRTRDRPRRRLRLRLVVARRGPRPARSARPRRRRASTRRGSACRRCAGPRSRPGTVTTAAAAALGVCRPASRSVPEPATTWPPRSASARRRDELVISLGTSGTAYRRQRPPDRRPDRRASPASPTPPAASCRSPACSTAPASSTRSRRCSGSSGARRSTGRGAMPTRAPTGCC